MHSYTIVLVHHHILIPISPYQESVTTSHIVVGGLQHTTPASVNCDHTVQLASPTHVPLPQQGGACAAEKQEWRSKQEVFSREMQETREALLVAKSAGDFKLVHEVPILSSSFHTISPSTPYSLLCLIHPLTHLTVPRQVEADA